MSEWELRSRQEPGRVSIDNFQELKNTLAEVLARYEGLVYTEASFAEAKTDKKELTRLRREIDSRRKEIKKAYLEPYNAFEAQIKELLEMIDTPLEAIKAFVSEVESREKEEKRAQIEQYFYRKSVLLGDLAGKVLESPAFFDPKWLNKTTSAKTWQTAVDEKIAAAVRDLQSIQATAGPHAGALTTKYLETMRLEDVTAYRAQLASVSRSVADAPQADAGRVPEDRRRGYKVLKISGSVEQLAQAMEVLELLGVECEELEDATPQPMPERTEPDFDSFVAFDLETSGTYGAANGDAPAEITEIGAVRVVNGEITEKFSQLVNPGRKIVPRIARITGITDAMVADQPDVETAIRLFAEFVGESILVGHNIKASDLYYVERAARRAGVRLENPFFDTYRYARGFKQSQGWEKLNLEYLSQFFGVEQPEAHRAWCDAQANAGVYLKLKTLT